MHIRALQKEAHNMALGKGWWPYPTDADGKLRLTPENIAVKLFRIDSEVCEAGESVGAREPLFWFGPDGKPEGLLAELADVVIRSADLAGATGGDLEQAILLKMEYNKTRKHRHGGKAL